MRHFVLSVSLLAAAHAASAQVLVATPDPIVFGTPTLNVFVDGELGGTLDWNNVGVDIPMPPGACGVRIDGVNLLEWAWYEGGVFGTTFMNIENNGAELPGEPGEWIEFTGPYGPGCGDEYVVHTPASMSGVVPGNAVKLVIQFLDYDDLVFLDAGLMPLPPPDPGGPDPEPPDPCAIPEFCGEPRDLVSCFIDWEGKSHCSDEAASLDLSLTGIGASHGLRALAGSFSATTSKVARNVGTAAQVAQRQVALARAQRDRLLRAIDSGTPSPDQARLMGRVVTSLNFAAARVAECAAATGAAQRSRKPGADGTAKRAALACGRAADDMLDLHEASTLLTRSLEAGAR